MSSTECWIFNFEFRMFTALFFSATPMSGQCEMMSLAWFLSLFLFMSISLLVSFSFFVSYFSPLPI